MYYGLIGFILIFYGICDSDKWHKKLLIWFIRIMSSIWRAYHLWHLSNTLINNSLKKYFTLAVLMKSITVFVLYLIVLINRKAIALLHNQIVKQIDNKNKVKIKKFSNILFVIWIFQMIVNPTIEAGNELYSYKAMNNFEHSIESVIIREVLFSLYNFGWLLTTVGLYCFVVFSLYELEKQFWYNLSHVKLITGYHLIRYRKEYFHLEKLRQSLNEKLGILPLIWFAELFSSTCFRITQITSKENFLFLSSLNKLIYYFYEYFIFATVLIIVAIFISKIDIYHQNSNHLIGIINERLDNSMRTSIEFMNFNQIINYNRSNCGLTAWNVFRLDHKIILTFTATVIPFTVMFIQLTQ